MATNDPRFVEVYRPRTAGKAHLIKNLLEEEGFTVLVENEYLQGVSGEIPGGWATCPRILVEASRALEARAFLERSLVDESSDEEEDTETDEGRCLACGAELPEDEERCPACGWSYQDEGGEE